MVSIGLDPSSLWRWQRSAPDVRSSWWLPLRTHHFSDSKGSALRTSQNSTWNCGLKCWIKSFRIWLNHFPRVPVAGSTQSSSSRAFSALTRSCLAWMVKPCTWDPHGIPHMEGTNPKCQLYWPSRLGEFLGLRSAQNPISNLWSPAKNTLVGGNLPIQSNPIHLPFNRMNQNHPKVGYHTSKSSGLSSCSTL